MARLLFEKTGEAVWISHLDLMRLFQRAFKRADLHLTHTQGFNPRPSVSIALPLSVGVESVCELLDFDLEDCNVAVSDIADRLNAALVKGVRVKEVYENAKKLKHLALLDALLTLEYDGGVPEGAKDAISELFTRDSLLVQKKGKNGAVEQDIIPMIKSVEVASPDDNTLGISARVCCQNPSLNPMLLCAAVERYLPQYTPDFCKCKRLELYDAENHVFR